MLEWRHLIRILLNQPPVRVSFDDVFYVRVDMVGANDEAIRCRVDILVLADRRTDSANAVGVTAFAHERHNLVLDLIRRCCCVFLEADATIVVVAKGQLILHEPVATNVVPTGLSHPTPVRTISRTWSS